jgi:dTDP-4-amino-4,6-dideoxygalactose transaminase
MTIPGAPIPSVTSLWQALSGKPTTGQPWIEKLSGKSVQFFSRGMWAMEEGVTAILDKRGKKNGQVWLPDYFCNEALIPLRLKEVSLYFYPIRKDLSPDWDRIELEVNRSGWPDVFILVHYFGFTNCLDESKVFCDKHGAELLEDCAHLLLPINGVGQNVSIFSPRKLLSLPEGGLLIMPNRSTAWQVNKKFSNNKKMILKWLVLRLSQRVMLTMDISWHHFRKTAIGNLHNNHANQLSGRMRMFPDKYTLKLLAVIEKGLKQIVEKRRENYMRVLQAVNGIKRVRPLFSSLPDYACPYAFPMIVSDGRDAVASQLNHFGIPAASWPDLPPEVSDRSEEHETAVWLQKHILLLPVHQDLSDKQVEYMAFKLREILGKRE